MAYVSWKFNRYQHQVNYLMFKFRGNRLRRCPGLVVREGVNNYGMVLQKQVGGNWVTVDRVKYS